MAVGLGAHWASTTKLGQEEKSPSSSDSRPEEKPGINGPPNRVQPSDRRAHAHFHGDEADSETRQQKGTRRVAWISGRWEEISKKSNGNLSLPKPKAWNYQTPRYPSGPHPRATSAPVLDLHPHGSISQSSWLSSAAESLQHQLDLATKNNIK